MSERRPLIAIPATFTMSPDGRPARTGPYTLSEARGQTVGVIIDLSGLAKRHSYVGAVNKRFQEEFVQGVLNREGIDSIQPIDPNPKTFNTHEVTIARTPQETHGRWIGILFEPFLHPLEDSTREERDARTLLHWPDDRLIVKVGEIKIPGKRFVAYVAQIPKEDRIEEPLAERELNDPDRPNSRRSRRRRRDRRYDA